MKHALYTIPAILVFVVLARASACHAQAVGQNPQVFGQNPQAAGRIQQAFVRSRQTGFPLLVLGMRDT